MSQANAVVAAQYTHWKTLCTRQDLVSNSGVVALLEGVQVALFYLPNEPEGERLFAIDNRDPKSGANVIGRGLVGSLAGDLVVVAPLYKQHFRLEDGTCLEYPKQALSVWPVRFNGDAVEVAFP
ncbi:MULTISPECIES: nitrite reductase small subunit NirD [Pseudomonas]|jgi:nitrite reductase (NADH) small subunit|uniref:Nitrite reductase small subunit NirD n=1 Tax=Pseudomonas spirodelae TaxID=3101751 RepID=A0ABU5P834_9PSED|nr:MULTISPECIES: nitrite reductase small subunit NirD [unclassified Pseudomonas]MBU0808345.1 nitrite reductase small subunit NirD [Gammaproteobacteria bacterium]MBU0885044.1 nitrite reductase small subunit NirD [Gammaproteobacteria bacterium]MBU1859068.1 nitrite reductase small subunit NirD [Gammaproteobacteria bacterium]MDD2161161.1 nitrite reductase small subunit NirD [Pseudomonas sp. MIL19]MEA1605830.1 nitrite reductase small subunit NirD [Pseudomonas sp. T5W1]